MSPLITGPELQTLESVFLRNVRMMYVLMVVGLLCMIVFLIIHAWASAGLLAPGLVLNYRWLRQERARLRLARRVRARGEVTGQESLTELHERMRDELHLKS